MYVDERLLSCYWGATCSTLGMFLQVGHIVTTETVVLGGESFLNAKIEISNCNNSEAVVWPQWKRPRRVLVSSQMHFSMKTICLHVVSRVWSKLKDVTMPKKAAFHCHSAALLDASTRKFKVECSLTYLVPATRDLIYDILKPTEGLISTKEHRFSKDKKTQQKFSCSISRLRQSVNAPTTVYYLAQVSISATSVHRPALMKTHKHIHPCDQRVTVLQNMWSGLEVVCLKGGLMNS